MKQKDVMPDQNSDSQSSDSQPSRPQGQEARASRRFKPLTDSSFDHNPALENALSELESVVEKPEEELASRAYDPEFDDPGMAFETPPTLARDPIPQNTDNTVDYDPAFEAFETPKSLSKSSGSSADTQRFEAPIETKGLTQRFDDTHSPASLFRTSAAEAPLDFPSENDQPDLQETSHGDIPVISTPKKDSTAPENTNSEDPPTPSTKPKLAPRRRPSATLLRPWNQITPRPPLHKSSNQRFATAKIEEDDENTGAPGRIRQDALEEIFQRWNSLKKEEAVD